MRWAVVGRAGVGGGWQAVKHCPGNLCHPITEDNSVQIRGLSDDIDDPNALTLLGGGAG